MNPPSSKQTNNQPTTNWEKLVKNALTNCVIEVHSMIRLYNIWCCNAYNVV